MAVGQVRHLLFLATLFMDPRRHSMRRYAYLRNPQVPEHFLTSQRTVSTSARRRSATTQRPSFISVIAVGRLTPSSQTELPPKLLLAGLPLLLALAYSRCLQSLRLNRRLDPMARFTSGRTTGIC